MRKARAVFAGEAPVVPKAGEDAVLVLVVADRAAEMATNVAQRLDLALVLVKKDVVIVDPARELACLLQFVHGGEIAIGDLALAFLNGDDACRSRHEIR